MDDTEILDEISSTEVGDARRMAFGHFNGARNRHDPSIRTEDGERHGRRSSIPSRGGASSTLISLKRSE
jgi:hypothetical protein